MSAFETLTSRTLVMPRADVDTDQIIPARFLTTTSRDGLGQSLFADWRYLEDGSEDPAFELNLATNAGAQILVADRNFGCGSSREHAPWALLDYGFRVIISTEIADIFRSNSLKNGLLPIVVDSSVHQALLQSQCTLTVDLADKTLHIKDGPHAGLSSHFEIDSFSRYCLMNGIDQLGFLLEHTDDIQRFETTHDKVSPA
ncbi:MAG: 3-isopropylmalate dehydratase small subunit [Pseudomonadota bacterium]